MGCTAFVFAQLVARARSCIPQLLLPFDGFTSGTHARTFRVNYVVHKILSVHKKEYNSFARFIGAASRLLSNYFGHNMPRARVVGREEASKRIQM